MLFQNLMLPLQPKMSFLIKMKKNLLLAAMMVASLSASAQFEPGRFSLQPKIGFNVAFLSNTESTNVVLDNHTYELEKCPNVGSVVGLELEYQAVKWLGIAAGLTYDKQGVAWESYKVKANGVKMESFDNEIDLGYINLPIVTNFYVAKGLALKTGVQFGFLTDAHTRNSIRTSYTVNDRKRIDLNETSLNVRKDFNKFDVAIPVGISYEFKRHFTIDARYNLGLLKVNKEDDPTGDSRNGVFQMTFGWKCLCGKK